jgi:thiol-disulfide isomerase/thioredoxin
MKKSTVFIAFMLVCGGLFAQDGKLIQQLMVGDDMPALTIDKWMKGGPIDIHEKGKVYLIDFWAAWCGPCVASMPHLSELSKKYKDDGLVVIGATSDDKWGNSYDQASKFLNDSKGAYDYNFAWLAESYRKDHKYKSIIYNPLITAVYDSAKYGYAFPQVFLVDRHGKIAFVGDGYSLQEDYIKTVLDDKHDISKERSKYIDQRITDGKLADISKAFTQKDYTETLRLGETILKSPSISSHTALVIGDMLLNAEGIESHPDIVDLGFHAAQKGVELTNAVSPGYLSLLAKGYALKKNKEMAMATAQKAADLAQGDFQEAIKKDLATYSKL